MALNIQKREILPSVTLTMIRTGKFKTASLSMTLLSSISEKTASMNALLSMVLSRGTVRHPDMESIAAELDDLYGARLEPSVRKYGDIQGLNLSADFVDDNMVPEGDNVFSGVASMMGEMLLQPATKNGVLKSDYVEGEREKLISLIESRINIKDSYSVIRLIEEMCAGEGYGVFGLGTVKEVSKISERGLTNYYRNLIATSPIKIFYCGSLDIDYVSAVLTEALLDLPRREIVTDLYSEMHLYPKNDKPRIIRETMDVEQGKLAIGFRLGNVFASASLAEALLFNIIYGSGSYSKLYMNVRERMSLCYYISSVINMKKCLMIVMAGIDDDKFDDAYGEILHQLQLMADGEITDEEMNTAKKCAKNALQSYADRQSALEEFYIERAVLDQDFSTEDVFNLIDGIDKTRIAELAREIKTDTVYFLGPNKEDNREI